MIPTRAILQPEACTAIAIGHSRHPQLANAAHTPALGLTPAQTRTPKVRPLDAISKPIVLDHNTQLRLDCCVTSMKRQRLLWLGVLIIIVIGVIVWGVSTWRQPTLNGKPESYWFKSLTIQLNRADMDEYHQREKEWQTLGTQGIPILFRAAEMRPSFVSKNYAKLLQGLPAPVQKHLPTPLDYRRLQSYVWFRLSFLTMQHTNIVIPEALFALALRNQEWSVRCSALSCLSRSVPLNSAEAKDNLLPLVLGAAHDSKMEVKSRAVLCLGRYRDQSTLVIPVLTNALNDPYPDVRIRAAIALHRLDPMAAEIARVKDVAYDCAKTRSQYGSEVLARQLLNELEKPVSDGRAVAHP